MNWRERLEGVLPFVMVLMIIYYGCPLFMHDTGSSILLMLAVMPSAAFLCSFFCGIKKGFRILYVILAAIIFIPEYWIFLYDWEALGFYLIMYTVIVFVGMTCGWAVNRIVKKLMER